MRAIRITSLAVAGALAISVAALASGAMASGLKVCVPAKENATIKTPRAGVCPAQYTLTELGGGASKPAAQAARSMVAGTYCVKAETETVSYKSGSKTKTKSVYTGSYTEKECKTEAAAGKYRSEAAPEGKYEAIRAASVSQTEEETLKAILPHIKYVASGVGGEPTIQFSGVNVQVVSGAGNESTLNGAGNLIVGYDESPGKQTGSNNLVVGSGQADTSYGSIIGGGHNNAEGPFSVVFGWTNTTSGPYSSVLGGGGNTASGTEASVSGGESNTASNYRSWIGGGLWNTATGERSAVTSGDHNLASGEATSVSGGRYNTASGPFASVTGGLHNTASGAASAADGGQENNSEGEANVIAGGQKNILEGMDDAVLGGWGEHVGHLSAWGCLPNGTGFNAELAPWQQEQCQNPPIN